MKKLMLLLMSVFLFTLCCCGVKQNKTANEKVQPDSIYTSVEQMPQFPGGAGQMMKYLRENLRYSNVSDGEDLCTRSMVRFWVDVDGSINDVKALKGSCRSLDDAIVELVRKMPKWEAGKQDGKPVAVYFTLPFHANVNKR